MRSQPNRFAVAPDHVAVGVEQVIEEHPNFAGSSKKRGEAGDIAEKARPDGSKPPGCGSSEILAGR